MLMGTVSVGRARFAILTLGQDLDATKRHRSFASDGEQLVGLQTARQFD
jgi:hypothetical protein